MKEPKYKIGDKVWLIGYGAITSIVISGIFLQGKEYKYSKDKEPEKYSWIRESILFPTKESLIQSL